MGSSLTTLRGSERVSPVLTFSILPMAPMSPHSSSLTSSAFLPFITYRRPSFSVAPVRELTSCMSGLRLPEMTFTKEYLPYWSETVFHTRAAGRAPGKGTNSSTSPSAFSPMRGRPSRGEGSSSTMMSSSMRVPRPETAEPHTTGKRDRSFTPWRRPWIISA